MHLHNVYAKFMQIRTLCRDVPHGMTPGLRRATPVPAQKSDSATADLARVTGPAPSPTCLPDGAEVVCPQAHVLRDGERTAALRGGFC
jgi:hypothetical protein